MTISDLHDDEVDGGDHDIDLEIAEGLHHHIVGDRRQLLCGDRRDDARAEKLEDELAADRRIDGADRRAQHDMADDLAAGEAERLAGLDLAAGDGIDPGAHDLGGIGAEMDREVRIAAASLDRRRPTKGSVKKTK